MPEYKLKTRIQNKYKTLVEWNSIQEGEFIPLKGEVCYAVDNGTLYQKIGDGTTDFTKLDWLFSKAIQSDWDENDPTSSAYIKNRICKIDKAEVPVEDRLLSQTSKIDFQIFNIEEATGAPPAALGLPENILNYAVVTSYEPMEFTTDTMAKLKNENNDIQVEIGGFYFNLADCERANIVIDEDLPPQTALMIGNPAMANAFFALMDMGESPFTMDTNKLTENFCLLVITMDYAESQLVSIAFMGDAGFYIPTDPENALIKIELMTQNTVYPIDQKYLSEAWSNQFEMDSTKASFIKNRYGDLAQFRGWDQEDPEQATDTFFQANYTVYRNNGNNIKITTNNISNNLPVYGLHGKAEIYQEILSYDVQINGIWYKDCPLIRASSLLTKGDTFYFIGNPKLINMAYSLYAFEAAAPNSDYTRICSMEDNGIPFLLIIDKDLNSANFLDDFIYGTDEWISNFKVNDTIDIVIAEAFISIATHMIPPHLLPYELSLTNWVFNESKNTIASKSAKTASGVNSFAIGTSTQATGISSVAIGNNTQATGLNAFAGGGNSIAAGSNSFAFGSGAWVNDSNQFAVGKYNNLSAGLVFAVGNGADATNRSNAFEVYSNGNVKAAGSIETSSVVLTSPNGTKFNVSIDNDGVLTATEIVKE